MKTELDTALDALAAARGATKSAFQPPAAAPQAAPPMDPAMQGAPPPQGAAPMDPAMAGGAPPPPMDPAMQGAPPPGDPAAGQVQPDLLAGMGQLAQAVDSLAKGFEMAQQKITQLEQTQAQSREEMAALRAEFQMISKQFTAPPPHEAAAVV